MSEREHHIKVLEQFLHDYQEWGEDLDAPICDYASSDCISKWQVQEVIQQKINALKENKDGNDKEG